MSKKAQISWAYDGYIMPNWGFIITSNNTNNYLGENIGHSYLDSDLVSDPKYHLTVGGV